MGYKTSQQQATVVKDKGGFYSTPITYMLDCRYRFKEFLTLSTIHQPYGCGFVDPGDTVEQYYPNSVDVAVMSAPGVPDVLMTRATYLAFQTGCLACCVDL